ncbi:MAG: NAD(P)H-dependent oxidoreductase [Cytophagaceae bacterium]|nr:NAD(P)H-dependent oxidoreductase [Cytophagaceae bacterium]
MQGTPSILTIVGSASQNSSNHKLMEWMELQWADQVEIDRLENLSHFPAFDPECSGDKAPASIQNMLARIEKASGVFICSPEYLFSIPSGLKNILEWSVSSTVFLNKPVGFITASASGLKAHEELYLILQTLGGNCLDGTSLLIPGIKGKFDGQGNLIDDSCRKDLQLLSEKFLEVVNKSSDH